MSFGDRRKKEKDSASSLTPLGDPFPEVLSGPRKKEALLCHPETEERKSLPA